MKPMMNRLTRLLALNRSAPREYKIEDAVNDETTIYMYDVIGYDMWTDGGITARQFAKDLGAVKSNTIHLRINSPGGDVFEGRAIVTALQSFKGKVIAHVDGLAASAASFIAMHADEIVMTDGSFMMIHNGWTAAIGDRHEMLETAALLEKIDGSITNDYEKRTGQDRAQLTAWMDAETWFTASEAVDYGFADRIATKDSEGNPSARAWNLSAYEHVPEAIAEPQVTEPEIDYAAEHAHRLRALALAET